GTFTNVRGKLSDVLNRFLQVIWLVCACHVQRFSLPVITVYESLAPPFPRLPPPGSRQFVLGRADNSTLEMARRHAPRSHANARSTRFRFTGGFSRTVRRRSPRSWLDHPQCLGRRRSKKIHHRSQGQRHRFFRL